MSKGEMPNNGDIEDISNAPSNGKTSLASVLSKKKKPLKKEDELIFDDNIVAGNAVKRKIIVQFWKVRSDRNGGNDELIDKKKIKFGKKYIKYKDRYFKINYNELKKGDKYWIYDTNILNSIGALAFHQYPEEIDSEQANSMLKDSAIEMYVKKGGMPFWWLLIAIVVVGVLAIVVAYTSVTAIGNQQLHELDTKQLEQNGQWIKDFRKQLTDLGVQPVH